MRFGAASVAPFFCGSSNQEEMTVVGANCAGRGFNHR
jgi:hypothetical protein